MVKSESPHLNNLEIGVTSTKSNMWSILTYHWVPISFQQIDREKEWETVCKPLNWCKNCRFTASQNHFCSETERSETCSFDMMTTDNNILIHKSTIPQPLIWMAQKEHRLHSLAITVSMIEAELKREAEHPYVHFSNDIYARECLRLKIDLFLCDASMGFRWAAVFIELLFKVQIIICNFPFRLPFTFHRLDYYYLLQPLTV